MINDNNSKSRPLISHFGCKFLFWITKNTNFGFCDSWTKNTEGIVECTSGEILRIETFSGMIYVLSKNKAVVSWLFLALWWLSFSLFKNQVLRKRWEPGKQGEVSEIKRRPTAKGMT